MPVSNVCRVHQSPRLVTVSIVLAGLVAIPAILSASTLLTPDLPRLLAPSDLHYDQPVERSEEGMPIGNGRMGSLVWTTPSALRLQLNRVDVFGVNRETTSFFERHGDYCGGLGFVDLDLGASLQDVFSPEQFEQHLSLERGLMTIRGRGVEARVVAWHEHDVIAIEIDDQRTSPEPIQLGLRMLRYASHYFGQGLEAMVNNHVVAVKTRNHTATSQLQVIEGRLVLTQEFREGTYLNRSAIVVGVTGRTGRARIAHESEARLTLPAAKGKLTVLLGTAATFDPDEDVIALALAQVLAAEKRGTDGLIDDQAGWWRQFWQRGFIQLDSADGTAAYVQENYHYFLHLMGATSRGRFPPKFNGMLWNTAGDLRAWGGQQWFANLSCYYEALPASNRLELLEPFFALYESMAPSLATAARQQWGSEGLYIPETVWFDGLAELPEDIATEMRELYLLRKPWEQRSARFLDYAASRHPHSSRWNWIGGGRWVDGQWKIEERGLGPYGPVSHIFGTTAKVPYLFWRHYEFTLDPTFLRERAWPMLKGAGEFYRNHPHLRRGSEGKYHLHHANSNESILGARDTDEDMSAMRGLFAAAIRASEILGLEADLRARWTDILAHLPPIPTSDLPDSIIARDYEGPRVWTRGLRPAVRAGETSRPDGNSLPMWFFDLCNLESPDDDMKAIANATFDTYYREGITADTPVFVLSKLAMAAATLGRADAVRHLIPNQMKALRQERDPGYVLKGGTVLANRMTLREGPQALDAQRLGRASEALHLALLQSNPPAPAQDPILRVFPAWPNDWNAAYTLRARGAFIVTSSLQEGRIEFVEITSEAGAPCTLRNPWGARPVTLHRNGAPAETLHGDLLRFATGKGETIVVVREGDEPASFRRTLPAR